MDIYVFYVDIFLLTNLLLHMCVFLFTAKIRKIHKRFLYLRMVGASVLGAALALMILCFIQKYLWYVVLSHCVIFPLMQLLAFGKRRFASLRMDYLCAYVVTFFLGGIFLAFLNLFGKHGNYAFCFVLCVLIGGGMIKEVLIERRRRSTICAVTFSYNNQSISCMGLIDTGNCLKEPFSKKGINIINEKSIRRFSLDEFPKQGQVSYESLGNTQGTLAVYQLDELCVGTGKEQKKIRNALFAVASSRLFEGKEYDVILEGDLWEVKV